MSRILVVDDDPPMCEVLQTILEGLGHEVMVAGNGHEALARQREKPADLMLTDIFMPEMEGLETIRQIRRLYPGIVVIAMSGGVPHGPAINYLEMAQRFGARQLLKKPFNAGQLATALREAGLEG